MHGLTGGSWKRSSPATDTTKNDPRETAPVTVASRPTAEPRHRASSRPSTRNPCPLKAAIDAAGQACSESSGTSSAAPRNRLPPRGTRRSADLRRSPAEMPLLPVRGRLIVVKRPHRPQLRSLRRLPLSTLTRRRAQLAAVPGAVDLPACGRAKASLPSGVQGNPTSHSAEPVARLAQAARRSRRSAASSPAPD